MIFEKKNRFFSNAILKQKCQKKKSLEMKKQIVFRSLFLIKIFRMKVLGDHIFKFYFQHFFKSMCKVHSCGTPCRCFPVSFV